MSSEQAAGTRTLTRRQERSKLRGMHTHTKACLAGNELDELCCASADTPTIMASLSWDVVDALGFSHPAFAPTAEDACALVEADGHHAGEAVRSSRVWPGDHADDPSIEPTWLDLLEARNALRAAGLL